MRGEEGDPAYGDAHALIPLALAAAMVGLSVDELQSRAQAARALRDHPRGKLIQIKDAYALAAPPRPRGRPRKAPKPETKPEQVKRAKRTPTPYAPPGCDFMPVDDVAAMLGVAREVIIIANANSVTPRPPIYRIKRAPGQYGWGYPRKETLEWIEEHGAQARAALTALAKRRGWNK